MTFSGKCWRRRRVVLVIAASLLGGCEMGSSDHAAATACPPVIDYTASLQAAAAADIAELPADSRLTDMLADYAVMREQARACAERKVLR